MRGYRSLSVNFLGVVQGDLVRNLAAIWRDFSDPLNIKAEFALSGFCLTSSLEACFSKENGQKNPQKHPPQKPRTKIHD